jgi:predicted secreted hydrolase
MIALVVLACSRPAVDTDAVCPDAGTPRVSLPADDALHTEFVEWWYWTGHLVDEAGRWYGFEHTVFVFQIPPYEATSVHLAFTDVDAATFAYDVQYAEGLPTRIENGFSFDLSGNTAAGGDGTEALVGKVQGAVWDLSLSATEPPVLQHGDGYHDYASGGYTYYYSRERIGVTGEVTVGEELRTVTGEAWFDHQYGDLLAATGAGWDWFALQLDDGREVMLFMQRGSEDVIGGSITDADGCTREIAPEDLDVIATGQWTSPNSGCTYPQGWNVTIEGDVLRVEPVLADQELVNEMKTYWEGAALVSGESTGRAYVELAGYCD